MHYNMDDKFISGPPGKAFPMMLKFIRSGQLAAAAFELMDSEYATQVGQRAQDNFLLLVHGHAAEL